MGYRFRPTDEELISYYLFKKSKGQPLPEVEGKILDRRMYGGGDATPWNVLKETDPWEEVDGRKIIYIFCKLEMTANKKRVSRTAGCGTWVEKAVVQEVRRGRRVIGLKRQLTFKPKKEFQAAAEGRGRWIMYEYSFPPPAAGSSHGHQDNYVICKIIKDKEGAGGDDIDDGGGGGGGGGDGMRKRKKKRRREEEENRKEGLGCDHNQELVANPDYGDVQGIIINHDYDNPSSTRILDDNPDYNDNNNNDSRFLAVIEVQDQQQKKLMGFSDGP